VEEGLNRILFANVLSPTPVSALPGLESIIKIKKECCKERFLKQLFLREMGGVSPRCLRSVGIRLFGASLQQATSAAHVPVRERMVGEGYEEYGEGATLRPSCSRDEAS
jgi:hypothetical protein